MLNILCATETDMETDTKSLIQNMKDSSDFDRIREKPLKTYYTCVKYNNQSAQWSCTKGWFEMYGTTFKGKQVDHKVLAYSRFRDTVAALKKDIGESFVIYIDKY